MTLLQTLEYQVMSLLFFFNRKSHFAVVGSGPSGFYCAQKLLQTPNTKVDIFEKLPFPYGLSRYGVAPDNQDVKKCKHDFRKVLRDENVRFFGNVEVGKEFQVEDLKKYYNGVVLADGAERQRLLGIPGDQYAISSVDFTRWYNKHPDYLNRSFDIGRNVAIIGNGNVSLDIARMLLFPDTLDATDINEDALKVLKMANVQRVTIFGRRTALHTSMTAIELRPFLFKPLNFKIHRKDMETAKPWVSQFPRIIKRVNEIFVKMAVKLHNTEAKKCLEFRFLTNPHSITQLGKFKHSVNFQIQHLDGSKMGVRSLKIIPTKSHEVLTFDTVFSSIGSTSSPLPGISSYASILGEPCDSDERVFCTGWNRSDGKGVIAQSLTDAHFVANNLRQFPSIKNSQAIINKNARELFISSLKHVISKEDWDSAELYEKKVTSKTRKLYKISNLEEMKEILKN